MKELSLPYQYERRRSSPLKWSNWYLSILKLAVGLLLIVGLRLFRPR